jgi:hypothetical protein
MEAYPDDKEERGVGGEHEEVSCTAGELFS